MRYGYCGKIAIVDLTKGQVTVESRDEAFYKKVLGGEGLGAWLVNEMVPIGADPLGEDNILCIASGFLTGSAAPASPRVMVMTKSPITGGFGDSNAGGRFGNELKKCGFDALVIRGKAPSLSYIQVGDGQIEIRDGEHLAGPDTVAVKTRLGEELGLESFCCASIGPAGERRTLISAIMFDDRAAARSGVGAVMGSKNLKAIVAKGSQRFEINDPELVKKCNDEFRAYIRSTNCFVIDVMRKYGSCGFMSIGIQAGIGPIKNWSLAGEESYPQHEKINGENVLKYRTKRHGCMYCPIACGGTVQVKDGPFKVEEARLPEYETIQAFAPFVMCDDIEACFKAQELCDKAGVDTISCGHVVAFAVECFENGILTLEDTGGLELRWGEPKGIIELTRQICEREGFGGEVLADGVKRAVERIGRGSEKYGVHIGGQEPAFHDFRYEAPSRGVTYISDPTPARHERCSGGQLLQLKMPLGPYPEFQPFDVPEGDMDALGRLYARGSKYYSAFSSCGFCAYTLGASSHLDVISIIQGFAGWDDFTAQDFLDAGERTHTLRQMFSLREGLTFDKIQFPPRLVDKPIFEGALAGKRNTVDFYEIRRHYFAGYGFDPDSGKPSKERMEELGIGQFYV